MDSDAKKGMVALRTGIRAGLALGLPVVSSGRLDWIEGWAALGLMCIGGLVSWLILRAKNPDLLQRRKRLGQGTKGWDKVLLALAVPMPLVELTVAGLDERFGWSAVSGWLWPVAAVGMAACFAFVTWAMVVNNHFEASVRVQSDIGHRVIDSGPYRLMRHPGYTGVLVFHLSLPLLLNSLWAYIPAVVAIALFVLRTALEDRTLRSELSGYAEYAKRVRYRLLPGVW